MADHEWVGKKVLHTGRLREGKVVAATPTRIKVSWYGWCSLPIWIPKTAVEKIES